MAMDQTGFPTPASKIRIFSDSQSALLSVQSWRPSACQEVVAEIVKKLWMTNVTLYWIPSHSGIEGNEETNRLAKEATREESEPPPQRDGRPWYLVKQALKKADITTGPLLAGRPDVGKFTRKMDAALHLGKAAALYQELNSAEAAILTQLRTCKTRLNIYLYKIKEVGKAETEAPAAARRAIRGLSYALGGYSSRQEGDKSIDGPIERWKPDIEVVRATIQFSMETRRLQTGSQDTASIEEDNRERQQLRIPTPTL
ncbi:hypothetical protein DM02DRAFT_681160 [Periconia macrospinosa]|uniref:RNase H type-1 domain-containing protein n=1 Tax=Periconia macrospinosa TaxID=97972 RepID=A0A2V1CYM3_9PLEO|nr:hypothetical protein DM02DRAFT_681160 [Periconia macrospinosa]